ncbi:MAG: hypothetical protein H6878_03720 [Rhodobiaceae bacterium]|nr:hypothetical protein [Rhodobiaceae bacterium]MCC0015396.1 hypothetical protein [Rhodobiaceae bacterium]MCC0041963.1 hypothetical protein [Rhodobiaceae bacterium]MCC0053365.1 hypothetical protein [Rhodobiaceae bacterium]
MIEWIMLFALGFCTAGLIALLAIPAVWRRAAKITGRRIRGALPVSMSEIQADKDQMRAEFAMSARKLERSVEELRQKTALHQAEIGKRDEIIRSQKGEISARKRAEEELQARIDSLEGRLAKQEKALAARDKTIEARDTTLAEREAALARREAELAEHSTTSDTRRVEIVALKTRVDALAATIADREETIGKRDKDILDRDEKISRIERKLSERDTELAARDAEIRRLRQSIEKQEKAIAEADANVAGLKRALAAERKALGEKEKEVTDISKNISERNSEAGRLAAQLATANKERVRAEEKLKQAMADAAAARDRVRTGSRSGAVPTGASMPSNVDPDWEAEKRENALLRERLNDLAAEVVTLTSTLDGEGGEIAKMTREVSEASDSEPRRDTPKTLAERIRALQSQVARH